MPKLGYVEPFHLECFLQHGSGNIWLSLNKVSLTVAQATKVYEKLSAALASVNSTCKMQWYVYTSKAVRNSTPFNYAAASRLLLVDGTPGSQVSDRKFVAWKFTRTPAGLTGPLLNADKVGAVLLKPKEINVDVLHAYLKIAKQQGSEATGMVTLDSWHKAASFAEIKALTAARVRSRQR